MDFNAQSTAKVMPGQIRTKEKKRIKMGYGDKRIEVSVWSFWVIDTNIKGNQGVLT